MSEPDLFPLAVLDEQLALLEAQLSRVREALRPALAGTDAAPLLVVREVLSLEAMEREYILRVLWHFDGNKTQTAGALGVDASTLHRKLARWSTPGVTPVANGG